MVLAFADIWDNVSARGKAVIFLHQISVTQPVIDFYRCFESTADMSGINVIRNIDVVKFNSSRCCNFHFAANQIPKVRGNKYTALV